MVLILLLRNAPQDCYHKQSEVEATRPTGRERCFQKVILEPLNNKFPLSYFSKNTNKKQGFKNKKKNKKISLKQAI